LYYSHAAGIFVFVCQHGVVVGFHIIDVAEGRNDAFTPVILRLKCAKAEEKRIRIFSKF
jgi:hypothetical protein